MESPWFQMGQAMRAVVEMVLSAWTVWTVTGYYGHPWSVLHVRLMLVMLLWSVFSLAYRYE